MKKTIKTIIIWLNRFGERREHSLGCVATPAYARQWFRESIAQCQGILSADEARNSQLRLLETKNTSESGWNGKA